MLVLLFIIYLCEKNVNNKQHVVAYYSHRLTALTLTHQLVTYPCLVTLSLSHCHT